MSSPTETVPVQRVVEVSVRELAVRYRRVWFSLRVASVAAIILLYQAMGLGLVAAFNETAPLALLSFGYVPAMLAFAFVFYKWSAAYDLNLPVVAAALLALPVVALVLIGLFIQPSVDQFPLSVVLREMFTVRLSFDTVLDVATIINYMNIWPPYALLVAPGLLSMARLRRLRAELPGLAASSSRPDRGRRPRAIGSRYWTGLSIVLGAFVVMAAIPLYWVREAWAMSDHLGQFGYVLLMVLVNFIVRPQGAFAFFVVCVAAFLLLRYGLRMMQPSARASLAADTRQPILLLRSFSDDHAAIWPKMFWSKLWLHRRRLEEVIAEHFSAEGPVIAVGAPGEALPELGASRAYLSDEEWQPAVKSWMSESRYVVMLAGHTRWITWELNELGDRRLLEKTLIVFPPTDEESTEERWSTVGRAIEGTPWCDALSGLDRGKVVAISFLPDGRLLAIRGWKQDEVEYELALTVAGNIVLRVGG